MRAIALRSGHDRFGVRTWRRIVEDLLIADYDLEAAEALARNWGASAGP